MDRDSWCNFCNQYFKVDRRSMDEYAGCGLQKTAVDMSNTKFNDDFVCVSVITPEAID